ncbi:hypothetical protein [Jiangella mangrovi]|uniref:Uncharacterized protein n=1 Tax=Jiangella mangrovi TaxID=1524084 RepID=A0A7W9GVR0_9ACTN|nr:hypothetical protein [Jiangella mangrovi]MBB5790837.1 hypothetical protein [Jiangella mangrovi]
MTVVVVLIVVAVLILAALILISARQAGVGAQRPSRYGRRRRVRMAPRLRLERLSQHRYVLHNDGATAAFDVRVDTKDLTVTEGETHMREFSAGHARDFLLIQPMHGHVSELTVRWRSRPGADAEVVTELALDTEVTSEGQEA